jgi:hypothetical protein
MNNLSAPKILLMGAPGTGKSFSLSTLIAEGVETFILATEPNAVDTVLDACALRKTDTSRLHWSYITPASAGWTALADMARTINIMGYEDIQKIKSGVSKTNTNQISKLIQALQDFKCDHCGLSFGDCSTWGPGRALVLDSLSGLNVLAMSNTIGLKPAAHQGEWGVAMNLEEQLIQGLTMSLSCYFVLTAHLNRERDEITGGTTISPAALGSKLGPRIGRFFSEVILAKRVKDQFVWSTSEAQTEVKNRALPISDNLTPTFKPIVDVHKRRQDQLQAAPQPEAGGPKAQSAA